MMRTWPRVEKRRSEAQRAFDYARHGWAFLDPAGLRRRIATLEQLAARLRPDDGRHRELRAMRRAAGGRERRRA